jgi:DNA-binding NarL/FixJ family response regulator
MSTTSLQTFTEREAQVIQLLLQGKSTSQIALQLGICTRAVEHHLTHVYVKLDVCSRIEAIIKLIHGSDEEQDSGIRN